jgi:O-antigen/teichoic acid export membrane protein
MQTTVSVLVALKRSVITTINLAGAVILKIALSVILLKYPGINIYGAAISAAACYAAASLLNIFYIFMFTGLKINLAGIAVKPFLCACITVISALGAYGILKTFLGQNISLILAVAACAPVFLFSAARLEVFTDYEIKYIPVMRLRKNPFKENT